MNQINFFRKHARSCNWEKFKILTMMLVYVFHLSIIYTFCISVLIMFVTEYHQLSGSLWLF